MPDHDRAAARLFTRTVCTKVCPPDLTPLQLLILFVESSGPIRKPSFSEFKIFGCRGGGLSKTIEIPTVAIRAAYYDKVDTFTRSKRQRLRRFQQSFFVKSFHKFHWIYATTSALHQRLHYYHSCVKPQHPVVAETPWMDMDRTDAGERLRSLCRSHFELRV